MTPMILVKDFCLKCRGDDKMANFLVFSRSFLDLEKLISYDFSWTYVLAVIWLRISDIDWDMQESGWQVWVLGFNLHQRDY
jgi:hypothetical protein